MRIQACGVCHSDSFTVEGRIPGIVYPRVPGHEVMGVVEAFGANVGGWKPGARAGVGWFGGSCGFCARCRRGDSFACLNMQALTGATSYGGFDSAGVATHSEDTLQFSRLQKIASINEIYPFDQAQAAYDRMMSGQARFRVVLKMS